MPFPSAGKARAVPRHNVMHNKALPDVLKDEDNGVDLDTGAPTHRGYAGANDGAGGTINYAVSRRSVFHRISTAGGKTARLMRTMSKISADLDRALLDLQGEIECDVDH